MTSSSASANRAGELVGAKYRIVRLMAQGGMGVVYEAQHTVVRRRFAVKFLRRDLAERRDILTRFHREAEAAGALESEHVAAAIDFGIAGDGAPYIVMEYLVGESLNALVGRAGPLPIGRAADLVSQAARGVEVAHAAGIIHRDLKPENLFVCRRHDGTDLLKVLDFGVAKLQAIDEMNAATRTGAVLGTVAYMSPEQARGDKVVDRRSDVFALGAILYEICTGRRPHPGDSPNAILHHIASLPAVPIESVAPELPAAFVEIVARTLASDPASRPPSAEALVEALAPFATREVWPAPKLDDSGATRIDGAPPLPQVAAAAEALRPASRRAPRLLLPALAVAAGVAVAVVAVVGAGRRNLSGPSPGTASRAEVQAPDAPAAATERPATAPASALATTTASASTASPPVLSPAAATGSAPGRSARRHATRPTADAPSLTLPAAPPATAPKRSVAPVTFDPQNPYE
jgi:tRNA A-37 threonylcarbamoyl transferase component Bud32